MERQRSALLARLTGLGGKACAHPTGKRALILINDTFRKCSVAQRRAVLDAADWLIGLLEQLTTPSGPAPGLAVRKLRRTLRPAAAIPMLRSKFGGRRAAPIEADIR